MSNQPEKQAIDHGSGHPAPEMPHNSKDDQPYLYRHAGIEERDGRIPFWLMLVVVGLLVWSAYYTIRFWSPD